MKPNPEMYNILFENDTFVGGHLLSSGVGVGVAYLLVRPYIQNRFGVGVKMQMYLLLESESW